MSAPTTLILVTSMQFVATPREIILVTALQDTVEMGLLARVIIFILLKY